MNSAGGVSNNSTFLPVPPLESVGDMLPGMASLKMQPATEHGIN